MKNFQGFYSKEHKEAFFQGHQKWVEEHGYPMQGKINWNRGLTKETNESIREQSESLKEWWEKNRETEKIKKRNEKLSKKLQNRKFSPQTIEKMKKGDKKTYKNGRIIWNKGLTKETDKRVLKYSKKHGKSIKKLWDDPNSTYNSAGFQKRMIKNALKALIKKPTKLEKKYSDFFKKYSLPFTYCGNGSLLIGLKNPDFIEKNGKKICVEVSNKIFRKVFYKINARQYETKRINYFIEHGWKCMVLWEEELKDEKKLLNKIITELDRNVKIAIKSEERIRNSFPFP